MHSPHSHFIGLKALLHKDASKIIIPEKISLSILLGLLLFSHFFIVLPRLRMLDYIVLHYYYRLPFSSTVDIDRDGVQNLADDSDGDGISDARDASPYGEKRVLRTVDKSSAL